MKDSKVVNIRHLAKNRQFDFKFTIIRAADENVCDLTAPSEFDFMPFDEVEMITSLLMSYFFSAEIFRKAKQAKENGDLGFVPSELIGETIILRICQSNTSGFTFEHVVPASIKGCVGERVIADSIEGLLNSYEEKLNDANHACNNQ